MKELPARARAYLAATSVLAALALLLSALAQPDWLLIIELSSLTSSSTGRGPGCARRARRSSACT